MSQHSASTGQHRRPFPIYATLLYVGLVVAVVVADALARRMGLAPLRVLGAMLVLIPGALAGARLLEVLLNFSYFRAHPKDIWRLDQGGATLYGGLLFGLVLSLPLVALFDLPFGSFWDIMIPSAMAGSIPARFGCLFAGCCAGRRARGLLAWRLPDARGDWERRLPYPLFEAALTAVVLFAALRYWDDALFAGAIALLSLAGYGAARFLADWLREDRGSVRAGLGSYQWISLTLVLSGSTLFLLGWSRTDGSFVNSVESAEALEWGRLILSGLLLIPVINAFRFLGCSILFSSAEPEGPPAGPSQLVTFRVVIPDLAGSGEYSVSVQLLLEPGLNPAPESPVLLQPDLPEGDGRIAFELETLVLEGDYRATCLVVRAGAEDRATSCSGTVDEPGLLVRFQARDNNPADFLTASDCFEIP